MARSVGETDGRISLLFRINQILIPIFCLLFSVVFVPWATFLTKNVILNTEFRTIGDRWTRDMAEASIANMKQWHHEDIEASQPPGWLIDRVKENTIAIERLESR